MHLLTGLYGIIVHPTYNRAFNVKAPETFVELLHNTSSLVWVSGIWMDLYQAPADGRHSNHTCRLHHCNKESIHTYIDTVSNTVCIHSTKVKYINVTTRRGSGTVKTS